MTLYLYGKLTLGDKPEDQIEFSTSKQENNTVSLNISHKDDILAKISTCPEPIIDSVSPVITLIGASVINLVVGDTFTDPGALATDNKNGDISSAIDVSGSVNTSTIGTYTLTYNVSDAAGNAAQSVTRTVNVTEAPDSVAPVITLSGASVIDLVVGDTFTDEGATATDDIDGDVSAKVVVSGTVDTSVAGSYTLTYTVSDAAGNTSAPVTRTVNVVDTTPPELSIECLTQESQINIVSSDGNKYVFNNSSSYDSTKVYGLTTGTYTFKNVPQDHPIALLNNNKTSEVSYNLINDVNAPIIINVSGGSTSKSENGDYYTFKNSNNIINIGNGGNRTFGFMRGKTYKFVADGISANHPFKIYMNNYNYGFVNNSGSITITIPLEITTNLYYQCDAHHDMKEDFSLLYRSVTGTNNDGTYDFYYGDITVNVTDNFDTLSVYCYYHGYMGGLNRLKYTDVCALTDAVVKLSIDGDVATISMKNSKKIGAFTFKFNESFENILSTKTKELNKVSNDVYLQFHKKTEAWDTYSSNEVYIVPDPYDPNPGAAIAGTRTSLFPNNASFVEVLKITGITDSFNFREVPILKDTSSNPLTVAQL